MINFNKTLNFMESTLSDEISDKFSQVFGRVIKGAASLTQYENKNRYIIYRHFSGWNFWCSLGYFDLNPDSLTEYPYLGIRLEVSPGYVKRPEIIEAMKEIVNEKSTEWTPYNLYTKDWSSIFYRKSLQDFLSKENHVSSIKDYFCESIKALEAVKKDYPDLPW